MMSCLQLCSKSDRSLNVAIKSHKNSRCPKILTQGLGLLNWLAFEMAQRALCTLKLKNLMLSPRSGSNQMAEPFQRMSAQRLNCLSTGMHCSGTQEHDELG